MTTVWPDLTPPYRTIACDPPWPYRRRGPRHGADEARRATEGKPWPYSQMDVAELHALDVEALADDNARLFVWTTPRFLHETFHLIETWGFTPGTTLTWIKKPRGQAQVTTEFLVRASRGRPPKLPWANTTWYAWTRPKEHSVKPPAAYDLIESWSPGPYVELFARQPRLGWDAWGHGHE